MLETLKRWFPLSAVKDISYLSLGKLFQYIAGFLYGVGGAYILGATGWGQLVFVIATVRVSILMFDLKIGAPTVKLFRERLENRSSISIREYGWAIVILQWASLGIFGVLFFSFLAILAPEFAIIESWQTALGIYALSEMMYVFSNWFPAILQAYEHFEKNMVLNVWTSFWRDYVVLLFMYYGGVEGACYGFFVAEVAVFVGVLGFLFYRFHGDFIRDRCSPTIPSVEVFLVLFQNMRSNYLAGLFSRLYSETMKLLLGGLTGVRTLGLYDIALKFKMMLGFITTPVTTYLYPRFIKKWNRDNKDEFFYTLRKYFYQFGPAYLILTVGIIGASPWLVPLFYSQDFVESVPIVMMILPAFALEKLFSLFTNLTFVISQQRSLITDRLIELLIALPVAYFWITNYGLTGAASALIFSILLRVCYRIYFFVKHFGWRWIIPY